MVLGGSWVIISGGGRKSFNMGDIYSYPMCHPTYNLQLPMNLQVELGHLTCFLQAQGGIATCKHGKLVAAVVRYQETWLVQEHLRNPPTLSP